MWKKKKFLTMEEQVAKLSPKCRELTEEESRMLNGGGSNDYGGYNNWSEYAYAMSHEAAGDANKTWMPEKKETSSSNTDSTSSSQKNTGNGTNGNQSSLSETTITPTEDGNTDSIMGTTSSTNTGSQSSTTPKTPEYYSNTCTAAMLAEYKGKLEAEKADTGKIVKWGSINQKYRNSYMQDYKNSEDKDINKLNNKMNGYTQFEDGSIVKNTFASFGCKMEADSKMSSSIFNKEISILDINTNTDLNKDGLITQDEIAKEMRKKTKTGEVVITDYWENSLDKEKLDNIPKLDGTTYVLGRGEAVHGGQHWVILEGYTINNENQIEFLYNGTSEFDHKNSRRYILGTPLSTQNEVYSISKIETYTIKSLF